MNVVIAGVSAAGLSAAEMLRRQGFDGRISLVGDEPALPYDRPPLSKEVLSGVWLPERVQLRDDAAIAGLEPDLRLGTAAIGADVRDRSIALADGSRLPHDELVVATGVRPRRLPGTDDVPGVHVLRTLPDALAPRAELDHKPRLVIVGAGFLGAEAAAVARQAGAEVTLVSDIEAPLSDVLGPELGSILIGMHRDHGVEILTGVLVREVLTAGGRAAGVRLADGRVLEAGAVLVSIGSVPNVELHGGGPQPARRAEAVRPGALHLVRPVRPQDPDLRPAPRRRQLHGGRRRRLRTQTRCPVRKTGRGQCRGPVNSIRSPRAARALVGTSWDAATKGGAIR
ncbi:NAD(P)/FAD-dependent oxidoreductase [Amycolatopsis acidiphila]|nr:NAD(P)/FAD-dependent oxidoreductase [Amycolatopsis acidiphila]UIJ57671.1 NAD(P)/FAD-dependent oxidoreductase [Amycolatopsis acidiphila]GHG95445.1 hypothetical protein GCM10017788_73870 [Amycolatopsis acidiphila]